jgi:phosphatidylglycerol:prolipoprotein diacylglycerol transferase
VNGDDFGRVSDVAWAVTYPPGSLAFDLHVRQGLLAPGASASLPVHPVQIYLAAAGLALFLVFSWLWRHRAFPPGALFALYWAADGAVRFALEFFRGDVERTYVGPFPDGQIIALGVSVAALTAFVWMHRRRDRLVRGAPPPGMLEEQPR